MTTGSMPRTPDFFVRPTLKTRFHIDYGWWDRVDRDLDVYLRSHLCPQHQEAFGDLDAQAKVDHVDPKTAEVSKVRAIEHTLISHCAQQADYVSPQTSLVNALFRIFLANGNTPLSPEELSQRTGRPAQMILRTLSGARVYKGIRPIPEN